MSRNLCSCEQYPLITQTANKQKQTLADDDTTMNTWVQFSKELITITDVGVVCELQTVFHGVLVSCFCIYIVELQASA